MKNYVHWVIQVLVYKGLPHCSIHPTDLNLVCVSVSPVDIFAHWINGQSMRVINIVGDYNFRR